jgi:maltose alpha-D-glucosyltransferase/alpha-amylase
VPALDRWIRKRRWFAGKGRPITAMRLASVLEPAPDRSSAVRIVLVEVTYADGDPDVYVVPLTAVDGDDARLINGFRPDAVVATLAGGGVVVDALNHEPSVLELVDAMVRRRRVGPLHAEPYPELRSVSGSVPPSVRVLSAEQSNSSVVIDEAVIVKLLRRLQGGLNPDVELSRHLRDVGFEHTAPLLGSLGWRHHGGVDTVAVAYRFVPNDGDAWVRMRDQLDSFFADVVREEIDEPVPPAPPLLGPLTDAARAVLGAAGEDLDLLGRRTAELHVALASGTDPDFAPEPVTVLYQRSLYSAMRSQLRTTIGRLRRAMRHLDWPTHALAEQVVATQDVLLGRLAALRDGRVTSKRIRVHGDYHLGQVLFTGRDFLIIDFEGEPGRTISERRIKRPALRDVAGMLRSFDYAAQVALDTRRQRGLVSGPDDDRLEEWVRWWRAAAGAAFMVGYFAVPEVRALVPDARDEVTALLDAFVLEKALYELNYELDNRPAWVRLPLGTLVELAT